MVRWMATSAYGLIDGDFCLWFDEWRLLPMVWLMATSAYGSVNGDFCLWFDKWRLLPMVRLMATSAYGLINGDFCLRFDGGFCQNDWLMGSWLMCFIPRNDDFCQDPDRWALSLRNNYFTINWDVILGRMPIIGLIFGLYPICGLNMGFTPLVGLNMGFTSSVVYPFRLYPICCLFEGLYPHLLLVWRALSSSVACLKGFILIYCLFEGLFPHQWFGWRALPRQCFDSSPGMLPPIKNVECLYCDVGLLPFWTCPIWSQRLTIILSYEFHTCSFIHAYTACIQISFMHGCIVSLILIVQKVSSIMCLSQKCYQSRIF